MWIFFMILLLPIPKRHVSSRGHSNQRTLKGQRQSRLMSLPEAR